MAHVVSAGWNPVLDSSREQSRSFSGLESLVGAGASHLRRHVEADPGIPVSLPGAAELSTSSQPRLILGPEIVSSSGSRRGTLKVSSPPPGLLSIGGDTPESRGGGEGSKPVSPGSAEKKTELAENLSAAHSNEGELSYLAEGQGRMRIATLCFLSGIILMLTAALPASRFGIQHTLYKRLVIRNTTRGFHTSDFEVVDGSYKSWYFFNVVMATNAPFTGNPVFNMLGPYTMQQYVKTLDVQFVDDVAYKSSATFGRFAPEYSCNPCLLSDKVTILNEMYMQMLAYYDYDELKVLRQFIPEILTRYIVESQAYFVNQKMVSAGPDARKMALQQFADCSPLKGASIITVGGFYSTAYAPEFCSWSKTWVKGNSMFMSYGQAFLFFFSSTYGLIHAPVEDVIELINPVPGTLVALPGFSDEMSVAVIEYLDYLAQGLGNLEFQYRDLHRNAGMFMTRTVGDILYGYDDPWLLYRTNYAATVGSNRSTWVAQIYDMKDINRPASDFGTFNSYSGINTGSRNISKLYWITQQSTLPGAPSSSMLTSPMNASSIDWDYGTVNVESSHGSLFGNLQAGQSLTMWLESWLRHVTLQHVGIGNLHGLTTYKYRLADSSLASCPELPLEKLVEEGPCLYPNVQRGVIDMTRFPGGSYESLPLFYRADPAAVKTWGPDALIKGKFVQNDFEFRMDVEPYFGATVNISIWIQKVYRVKRSTLLYPNMTDVGSSGILFPVSCYHVTSEANETVCAALAASRYAIGATEFLLTTVLPLIGVTLILCGVHIWWRKRMIMFCCLVCVEGNPDREEAPEIVTALVVDQARRFAADEMRQEATRTLELRQRHFHRQLLEHDISHQQLKKYYAARPIPTPVVRRKLVTTTADASNLKASSISQEQKGEEDIAGTDKIGMEEGGNDVVALPSQISPSSLYEEDIHHLRSSSLIELGHTEVVKSTSRRSFRPASIISTSGSIRKVEDVGSDTIGGLSPPRSGSGSRERLFQPWLQRRAPGSSLRAKSLMVVEEGRSLIDILKARQAGAERLKSAASIQTQERAVTTEPTFKVGTGMISFKIPSVVAEGREFTIAEQGEQQPSRVSQISGEKLKPGILQGSNVVSERSMAAEGEKVRATIFQALPESGEDYKSDVIHSSDIALATERPAIEVSGEELASTSQTSEVHFQNASSESIEASEQLPGSTTRSFLQSVRGSLQFSTLTPESSTSRNGGSSHQQDAVSTENLAVSVADSNCGDVEGNVAEVRDGVADSEHADEDAERMRQRK